MDLEKKCNGCKKILKIENFTSEEKESKVYSKCHLCRAKLVKIKNRCKVCGINACYNFQGENEGIYCKQHSQAGMIDIKHKKCENENCKKRPIFNYEGETNALYCKYHSLAGMIDIISKRCSFEDCKKRPTFNFEGETNALYCKQHSQLGMIDIISKRCSFKDCKKRPNFNFEGEEKALYCKQHSQLGMIDIKNKRCISEGCKKNPLFNFEGEVKRLYCKQHSLSGMVDIKNKRCISEGCKKNPLFNFEGEEKALYCKQHSQLGMIDIKNKRCISEGCKKQPTFNFEGEEKALYCKQHSQAGMVNIKDKKCSFDNCRLQAIYNLPNMFPAFCKRHKKDGMLESPRKKCLKKECNQIAQYGILTPLRCEIHKIKDDINLVERHCQNKLCQNGNAIDILDHNGFCVSFCSALKQYEIYKKHQKKKEEFVGKLLERHIHLPFYMRDSAGDNGCSNNRPDFVYHLGTHILIIEVDENQHKSYTNCGHTKEEKIKRENNRMYNISGEFDFLPIIWLRYNPDNFKVDGKNVKIIESERQSILIKWVEKCISYKDFKGILVKYLFYDEYKETDNSFTRITQEDLI
jgi:hypothetical protein